MMKFSEVRILFLLLFIISCNVNIVRNGVVYSGESDINILRRDGLYLTYCNDNINSRGYSCEIYTCYEPLKVINSNSVTYGVHGGYTDSIFLSLEHYKTIQNLGDLGGVIIKNDTVYANIPVMLEGNNWLGFWAFKPYECSFKGYIKNKDTIVDWHLVPPYPNIKIKENYMDLVEPRMLYFIESKELLGLDSLYKSRKLED